MDHAELKPNFGKYLKTTKETYKIKNVVKTNIGILRIFRNNFIIFLLFESSEKMWKYINYEFDVYFKKCVERASRFLKSLKSQNFENFLKILGHRRLAIWASEGEY